jgi:fluoride ion exporter CrcB/FEX
MTTEQSADPILPEPPIPNPQTDNIPLQQWTSSSQPESSTDTGISTPIDPLDPQRPQSSRTLEDSIPRPLLVKARTTGDFIQHRHDESRRRFLIDNGGPLAARNFPLSDDYGLDELRAPPILPDRERRKSLEHAWSHKPTSLLQRTLRQRLHEDIVVASWITFLSIWGSLARIGLSALSTYPGQPVFPLIWAQFVGCAVMGFLLQDKTLFPKEDRYVALYIGLTTGFCGSVTSFSTFMWNCFQALANIDPYFERARGKNVLALFSQVIITLCISIAALRFGAHCAQLTRHLLPSVRQMGRLKPHLDSLGILLAVAGWAAAGVMTGVIPKWRPELFTAVLAPAGESIISLFLISRGALSLATLKIQPGRSFVSAWHICRQYQRDFNPRHQHSCSRMCSHLTINYFV